MDDPVILMLVSVVVAVVYVIVLFHFGRAIGSTLQGIGAREPSTSNRGREQRSYLSKIWFGVRAIETEVGQLAPQAVPLNEKLKKLAGGLTAIGTTVAGILSAAEQQAHQGKGK